MRKSFEIARRFGAISEEFVRGTMSLVISVLYEFCPFRLDVEQRVFTRAGEVLPLAPKTFDLLVLFLQRPGHAFSRQELMSAL